MTVINLSSTLSLHLTVKKALKSHPALCYQRIIPGYCLERGGLSRHKWRKVDRCLSSCYKGAIAGVELSYNHQILNPALADVLDFSLQEPITSSMLSLFSLTVAA